MDTHEFWRRYCIDEVISLPDDFSIMVDLVLPSPIDSSPDGLYPASNRICKVKFKDNVDDWCTVRIVSINSFYFWILIQDKIDDLVDMNHVEAVLNAFAGTYLNPDLDSIKIIPSGRKTVELHKDWAATYSKTDFPPKK